MRLRTVTFGSVLVLGLAACGGGGDSDSGDAVPTTISPLGTTTFRTIPASTSTLSPEQAAAAADPGALAAPATHEVQPGDWPLRLNDLYGCKWEEVAAFNDYQPEDFEMVVGEVLNLPPACSGQPAPEVTSATQTTAAAGETPTATEAPAATGSEYEVQAGDTLWGIATNFNVTPSQIATANGWSDGIEHNINPGDKIKLPAPPAG